MDGVSATATMEELIKLITFRTERALAELHRVMRHRIVTFVLQRPDNTTLAEEVMLETLFEFCKHAPWFAGGSRPTTWIPGIAWVQDYPTNTVKTRMFDARRNLHECMEMHGHEERR